MKPQSRPVVCSNDFEMQRIMLRLRLIMTEKLRMALNVMFHISGLCYSKLDEEPKYSFFYRSLGAFTQPQI